MERAGRPDDGDRDVAGDRTRTAADGPAPPPAKRRDWGAETNTVRGTVLKYTEPPEAKKPTTKWRLHVFKGSQQLEPLRIFRQSAYLFGRERLVADIPTDHPTCSKQHAVIQYRQVTTQDEIGQPIQVVKPYVIDLESANGTFLNGDRIEPRRYIELKEKDCLRFAESTRDYILLVEPE